MMTIREIAITFFMCVWISLFALATTVILHHKFEKPNVTTKE